MSHVLIVDDEPSICWSFRELLTDEGHRVSIAPSAEDALELLEEVAPDAVMLDVRLPGIDGLSAMARMRDRLGDAPIIVMTAFGNLETAVRAVEAGAFDYLTKPFDLEQAARVLQRAIERAHRSVPPPEHDAPLGSSEALVGSSQAMQAVFKQIALVAPRDTPVLVTGESGTGKDLVAKAIHKHSRRAAGPFIPVCLAALNPSVIESELFGHVRGAFTGAEADRKGLLEFAHDGTVFLDEIGDVPLPLQVKLLRAIEQREITPVGNPSPRATNFRIVAATNRPLQDLVAAGEFREDLFYRLSVFHIQLPPLRQRHEDIPALAETFLSQVSPTGSMRFSPETIQELCSRPWYGNVRELRNAVERASIVARGDTIDPEHLPHPVSRPPSDPATAEENLCRQTTAWISERMDADDAADDLHQRFLGVIEPPLLAEIMARCSQNRTVAARWLGIHRATLRQKLRQYGLEDLQ